MLYRIVAIVLLAQWVNVQVPNTPRTPDGKPNLEAPPPGRLMGSRISPEFGESRMDGTCRISPSTSVKLRFSPGRPHSLRNAQTRSARDVPQSTAFHTVYPTECSSAIHHSRLFKRPVSLWSCTKNSIITGRFSPMAAVFPPKRLRAGLDIR